MNFLLTLQNILYKIFYELIITTLQEVVKDSKDHLEEDDDYWIYDDVSENYYSNKGTGILYDYLPGIREHEVDSIYAYQDHWGSLIESPLIDLSKKYPKITSEIRINIFHFTK